MGMAAATRRICYGKRGRLFELAHGQNFSLMSTPGDSPSGRSDEGAVSFAYFMRPDDETPIKAVKSPLIAEAEEEKQGQDVFTSR